MLTHLPPEACFSLAQTNQLDNRNWSNQLWFSHRTNKHWVQNHKPQSLQRASALTAGLIEKMVPCFPWTPPEPARSIQMMPLCLCLTPAWKQTFPAILEKLQGTSGASRERTWLSAAEASAGRENTLLPLACDSAFNKRLICCDTLFLSPVDLWQGCCRDRPLSAPLSEPQTVVDEIC